MFWCDAGGEAGARGARARGAGAKLAGELGGLETAVADVSQPADACARWWSGRRARQHGRARSRAGATPPSRPPRRRRALHRLDRRAAVHPRGLRASRRRGRRLPAPAMLTAFGYDCVPGNLAGALALERAGDRGGAGRGRLLHHRQREHARGDERRHHGVGGGRDARRRGFAFRGGRIVTERAAKRVRALRRRRASADRRSRSARPSTSRCRGSTRAARGGRLPRLVRPRVPADAGRRARRACPASQRRREKLARRFVKGSTGGPDAEARSQAGSLIGAGLRRRRRRARRASS